jgi:hypothetical protein
MTIARSVLVACLAVAAPAAAQSPAPSRPAPVFEGTRGWAGFGDEGLIHHAVGGAGARVYVSRRVSLGPEVQFFIGPDTDSDLMLTGNMVVDLLAPTADRPRRSTPYLLIGGGLFRHSDRFASGTFASTEGGVTAGAGVRVWLTDRVYVAGDARLGWEPHIRLAATVGVSLDR